MTVTSTTTKPRRVELAANGVLTDFDFDFKIYANDQVLVYLVDSNGTATLKTITTHYTVAFDSDDETGTVTFLSAPASGNTVLMLSSFEYEQPTDIRKGGGFSEPVIEKALDRLAIQIQQLKEITDRAIIQNITASSQIEFPSASADKILGWNAAGTGLENKTPASLSSAFDITLSIADADQLVSVNAAGDGYEVRLPSDYSAVTPVAADLLLIGDVSDSNNLKRITVQALIDLATLVDINGKTDTVITASDAIIFSDASDSNNNKKDTVQGILDLVPVGAIGVISFDLSTTTGTSVSVTGLSFTPSNVCFTSSVAGNAGVGHSIGVDNGTTAACHYKDASGNWQYDSNSSVRYDNSANTQQINISSLDASGFTLSNTKGGTPTGTMIITYKAR